MAELHDKYESQFRARLIRQRYKISKKHPFVDYRPDIYATNGKLKAVVEVEIESTLYSDHTIHQLELMHRFIRRSRNHCGYLIVPKKIKKNAEFQINSIFGDDRIKVVGL